MKLIDALQEKFPDSSHRTIKLWLRLGRIFANGRRLKVVDELPENAEVCLDQKKEKTYHGISFLFSDPHIVVIEKPKGLLSVPQDIPGETSALRLLRNYYKLRSMYPVHRLDRETSGVMVFAKTSEAREVLKETFYNRDLTREYYALVWGYLSERKGTWTSYLYEDSVGDVHVGNETQGKKAITHYEVVERRTKHTLLKLKLETGKKHQIRVHCSSNNIPIVGDDKYAQGMPSPYRRLCLHAKTLEFKHPITGEQLSYTSTLKHPLAPIKGKKGE